MLHRVSDRKASKEGQYLTLELSDDRGVVLFEAGHLIPADSDLSVYLYHKDLGFSALDFNADEHMNAPYNWNYMPCL